MLANENKWKCPKCESTRKQEKAVRISGSLGQFNMLIATACICSNCGYIELYKK